MAVTKKIEIDGKEVTFKASVRFCLKRSESTCSALITIN